jgi:multiple sugar transport system substrate-binding protein
MDNQENAESYHFDMEMDMSGDSSNRISIIFTGDYAKPELLGGLFTMKIGGITIELEMVLAEDEAFITNVETGEWESLTEDTEFMSELGQDMWESTSYQPEEFKSLILEGVVEADGRSLYKIKGILPGSLLSDEEVEVDGDVEVIYLIGVDDNNVYLVDLAFELIDRAIGEKTRSTTIVNFSDYDEPVTIEIPDVAAPAHAAGAGTDNGENGKVQVRWFVGLGTGSEPEQIEAQEAVVEEFNASQEDVELVIEFVPNSTAQDTLATQIALDKGPDIIGPVGWVGSNAFQGQWLDMQPLIAFESFDLSQFDPELLSLFQTEEGHVGLPLAVYPGAMFFIPQMFDQAGLAYPPQKYGERYELDGKEVEWNWDTVTEVARRLTIDENGLNATEDGFDATAIVQFGYHPQWQKPNAVATFYGGAAKIYDWGRPGPGSYTSTIPDSWKEAWQWWHEGMHSERPFMADGPSLSSALHGEGNFFNEGEAAMALTQMWYLCCLGEFRDAGNEFQLAVQPSMADGTVQGRIDADTFRMWSGSKHPQEAFQALTYLLTDGAEKLLPVYGGIPAASGKSEALFDVEAQTYPFVTSESWNVLRQGLDYPDTPSAEQFLPNTKKAYARIEEFWDLLLFSQEINYNAEFDRLEEELEQIYNEEPQSAQSFKTHDLPGWVTMDLPQEWYNVLSPDLGWVAHSSKNVGFPEFNLDDGATLIQLGQLADDGLQPLDSLTEGYLPFLDYEWEFVVDPQAVTINGQDAATAIIRSYGYYIEQVTVVRAPDGSRSVLLLAVSEEDDYPDYAPLFDAIRESVSVWPEAAAPEIDPQEEVPAGYLLYEDESEAFQLSYPAGWHISDSADLTALSPADRGELGLADSVIGSLVFYPPSVIDSELVDGEQTTMDVMGFLWASAWLTTNDAIMTSEPMFVTVGDTEYGAAYFVATDPENENRPLYGFIAAVSDGETAVGLSSWVEEPLDYEEVWTAVFSSIELIDQ